MDALSKLARIGKFSAYKFTRKKFDGYWAWILEGYAKLCYKKSRTPQRVRAFYKKVPCNYCF